MEVIAVSKSVRISPRKVRLIVDSLHTSSPEEALLLLSQLKKRSVIPIVKTIKSALANASHNAKLASDVLKIKSIDVQEGVPLKRFHASTRGRAHPYKKRSSSIRVVLEEKVSSAKAESKGKGDKK